jgi:tRNA-dihydrouridine synthase
MVSVHGRTRCQFYTGTRRLGAVRAVKDAISIPLAVNGDIRSFDDADAALRASGADAVMVGRAAQGGRGCPARSRAISKPAGARARRRSPFSFADRRALRRDAGASRPADRADACPQASRLGARIAAASSAGVAHRHPQALGGDVLTSENPERRTGAIGAGL